MKPIPLLGILATALAAPGLAREHAARDRPEQVCVVQGDSLRLLTLTRSSAGDSLVGGVPFRTAHPPQYPPYLAAAPWYLAPEPVRFGNAVYGMNHPPQVISRELLRFEGRYRGVAVFRAADEDLTPPSIIYLPLRPGCVFQPFDRMSGYRMSGY